MEFNRPSYEEYKLKFILLFFRLELYNLLPYLRWTSTFFIDLGVKFLTTCFSVIILMLQCTSFLNIPNLLPPFFQMERFGKLSDNSSVVGSNLLHHPPLVVSALLKSNAIGILKRFFLSFIVIRRGQICQLIIPIGLK